MHHRVGDLVTVDVKGSQELGMIIRIAYDNCDAYNFSEHAKSLSHLRALTYYVLLSNTNELIGPIMGRYVSACPA